MKLLLIITLTVWFAICENAVAMPKRKLKNEDPLPLDPNPIILDGSRILKKQGRRREPNPPGIVSHYGRQGSTPLICYYCTVFYNSPRQPGTGDQEDAGIGGTVGGQAGGQGHFGGGMGTVGGNGEGHFGGFGGETGGTVGGSGEGSVGGSFGGKNKNKGKWPGSS